MTYEDFIKAFWSVDDEEAYNLYRKVKKSHPEYIKRAKMEG